MVAAPAAVLLSRRCPKLHSQSSLFAVFSSLIGGGMVEPLPPPLFAYTPCLGYSFRGVSAICLHSSRLLAFASCSCRRPRGAVNSLLLLPPISFTLHVKWCCFLLAFGLMLDLLPCWCNVVASSCCIYFSGISGSRRFRFSSKTYLDHGWGFMCWEND